MEPTTAACRSSTLKGITTVEGRGGYQALVVYKLFLNGRDLAIATVVVKPPAIKSLKPFHLPIWTGLGQPDQSELPLVLQDRWGEVQV